MDWPSIYRIAALSGSDPKTVKRVADGRPTRPTVRVRVLEAMRECGLVPPAPATPNTPSEASSEAPGKP